MDNSTPPKAGLARAAALGSGAAALSRGLRALIGIGTISLLSRFLTPTEFGLFALIFFLITFTQVFADFGLRIALVQQKEVSRLEQDSVFWASLTLGTIAAGLMFALAGPIASLFDEPRLTPYVRAIAPILILVAAQGVPMSMLEREFRFQSIAKAEFVAGLAGAVVAVGLAAGGASVFALLAQQYAICLTIVIMCFRTSGWRPRLAFSLEALRPLIAYSSYITLAGVLGIISGYAERPVVGKKLPPADLGYLTLAQQIIVSPVRTVTTSIRRTIFPILSSLQAEPARIALGYLTTLHATFIIMAPVLFGIWAMAVPITDLLLGPKWAPVADVLGPVAIYTLLSTVLELNNAVLSARGVARFQFHWNMITAVTSLVCIYFAADHGLMAVVWTRFAMQFLFVPIHSHILARMIGINLLHILSAIWRPILAAALMGMAVLALDQWLTGHIPHTILRLPLSVATGVLLYAVCIWVIDRKGCTDILRRVRERI
ncbi:lipopolysaccharide biosynthesis protein [Sandaracinobacter neustonicus]|uniref:Lipopolysaccharide biosynthesis protein n=1 Tax=Sandaracinobacter neustonicus TaxID=1715348 RepID=A0A501XRY8_9SPHN|nr:lipopolysaccharide biosynthesis protein [Sandaracinobacter neustonicus]TPE63326.1 lipopolysaccharide biosynthesis protein [Sandaracinobacter neustonicus]